MKIIFATNNPNKLKEIKNLMPKGIEIVSLQEIGCTEDIPETGDTLEANALEKAHYLKKHYGYDCFADDSGLEVDLLDGDPGIFSARWGGKRGDFKKAMNRVYKELDKKDKNWRNKKIKARFVCALTVCHLDKKIINSVGKIEGYISPLIKGRFGFGYDPIFLPIGKLITFGEMKPFNKYKIDHRFKAFKRIKKFF